MSKCDFLKSGELKEKRKEYTSAICRTLAMVLLNIQHVSKPPSVLTLTKHMYLKILADVLGVF